MPRKRHGPKSPQVIMIIFGGIALLIFMIIAAFKKKNENYATAGKPCGNKKCLDECSNLAGDFLIKACEKNCCK